MSGHAIGTLCTWLVVTVAIIVVVLVVLRIVLGKDKWKKI